MATSNSPTALPPSAIRRDGKQTIVFAEDSEAFRVACAAEAVHQASALLNLLDREFEPGDHDYDFCVVFESTMRRVKELLDSVNIGPSRDEAMDDQRIADVVFGAEDLWLIGERVADGRIVAAGSGEMP